MATKEARLEIRLTREQKSLLVRAANLRGASVADFVRRAAQEVAAQVVTEHEVVRLCAQDQEAFAAALLAPREPGATFEAVYADYRERIGT